MRDQLAESKQKLVESDKKGLGADARLEELESELETRDQKQQLLIEKHQRQVDELSVKLEQAQSEIEELQNQLQEADQPRPSLMELAGAEAAPSKPAMGTKFDEGSGKFVIGSQDKGVLELVKRLKKENRKRKQADALLEEVEEQRNELARELKLVREKMVAMEDKATELLDSVKKES